MQRIQPIYLFLLACIPFFSCKNDIDINADWKETIVVYGLLDPIDTVQYIRVEKAYLDDKTGALIIAKITDSLFLDSVSVILKPETGSDIVLTKTLEVAKDSGIFGNDKNPLWKTTKTIVPDMNYTLEVINLRTGNRISAKTKTLAPAFISSPVKNPSSYFTIFAENITFEFTPKANSYTYDVKMDFVYEEFPILDTTQKTIKTTTWNVITNMEVTPNSLAVSRVPRAAFLQFLSATIKTDSSVQRRVKYVNIHYYGGNETLADYISVNQPSIGIVQKTAEFTNIEGGYGIFASRCTQSMRNVRMDAGSISLIMTNVETKKLNFIH